jgi:hypothetical protein
MNTDHSFVLHALASSGVDKHPDFHTSNFQFVGQLPPALAIPSVFHPCPSVAKN